MPFRLPLQNPLECKSGDALKMDKALIQHAREQYHKRLIESRLLTISSEGIASNADSSNIPSRAIAKAIAERFAKDTIFLKQWIGEHPDYILIIAADHGHDEIGLIHLY